MLKNYFKIAIRNLFHNKVYSFINIFGLTIGLACFLILALYIFDELTFDTMHRNADNIYRVVEQRTTVAGKESKVAGSSYQLSKQGPVAFPEIKNAVRLTWMGRSNVTNPENNKAFYEPIRMVNQQLLEVFDFPIVEGDRQSALTGPNSIIITEDMAHRLFGNGPAIGKMLQMQIDSLPFKVTAVLKNFPANSHLSFNLLVSEAGRRGDRYNNFINNDWASNDFTTYFLVDNKADIHKLEKQLNGLVASGRRADNTTKSNFILQPLKKIHFYSDGIDNSEGSNGNIMYIYVFSIVAIFVLLIACINYMNLTTARFFNRAKEIAVRKVAGADRKSLVGQFLSEAMVMTLIATVLAIALVILFLPLFNGFAEKQLNLGFKTDYRIWLGIAGIVILVGLLSGAYPALIQSGLKPLLLLKNKITPGKGSMSIRQTLVVFQFVISIIMIVATLVVYLQLKYVNAKDMGFTKDQLLVVDINSGAVRRGAETIKAEFGKLSTVKNVTVSSRVPGEWKIIPKAKVKKPGSTNADGDDMYFIGADDQFLKTFEISLLSGRNFQRGSIADSFAVMINETAARMLGITNPSEQVIEIPSADYSGSIEVLETTYRVQVIGIVKDFNFRSLREPVAPLIIAYKRNPIQLIDYFTARVSAANMPATIEQMGDILHSIDHNHLFEYHFLDKQWDLFYQEDQKRQIIFIAMALMTILIACLGLFGLATYAAEQRIKEIGVRKVLGASVTSIVGMLSKDFLKLVLIASIIALPAGWWFMHTWLKDFAYRVNLSWWVFAGAGIIAMLIAFLTISFQAIKAATANPIKSLRTE